MQVVLDTNIILKSPRMDNDLFKALYRYLETTGSSLKLSTIVKKEIEAGYKKRLKKQNREYLLSSKYLNGLTMSEVPIIQLDYDTENDFASLKVYDSIVLVDLIGLDRKVLNEWVEINCRLVSLSDINL